MFPAARLDIFPVEQPFQYGGGKEGGSPGNGPYGSDKEL
jgi:hypothetical protein